MINKFLFFFLLTILLACSCKDDEMDPGNDVNRDLTGIDYAPQNYEIIIPKGYPPFEQPEENKMSVDGVLLGRELFYETNLSADNTMSCGSCHFQTGAFTDNLKISEGIDGIAGTRSSMSLINLAYNTKGFFWDGRTSTLEIQALQPVEDPIELHNDWEDVVEFLQTHDTYPEKFRKAFGINNSNEITKDLAAKAIAQFERSLISSGNSEFDRVFFMNDGWLSDDALNGYDIFFDEPDLPDGECSHCHNEPLFTNNDFKNNGLQYAETLQDFQDLGLGLVNRDSFQNGFFREPTLINWEFSAPYMHDGSLATIDDVLDHYISGGKYSPNKDPLIYPHDDPNGENYIDETHRGYLLAFLKTLTDTTFLNNENYSDPN